MTIFDQLLLAFLAGVLGSLILGLFWMRWMFREARGAMTRSRDDMMHSLRESIGMTVAVEVEDQLRRQELRAKLKATGSFRVVDTKDAGHSASTEGWGVETFMPNPEQDGAQGGNPP